MIIKQGHLKMLIGENVNVAKVMVTERTHVPKTQISDLINSLTWKKKMTEFTSNNKTQKNITKKPMI